ncbi:MAG: hemolysin III family protein [Acidimicrobiales bacterium]
MTDVADDAAQLDPLSPSARRLLRRPRPAFRGVLHRWAAIGSVLLGVVLVVVADGSRSRLALGAFAVGTTFMLSVSAFVHHRDWGVRHVENLVRLDHSAIFVMFATSTTPTALLGLEGRASGWMIGAMWAGATAGIVAEWLPVHPPPGVVNTVYMVLGWSMLVFLPSMLRDLTALELALMFGGGAAYTIGAVIVGSRRPDPWPDVFGYHEIWHALVVVAVVLHGGLALTLGTG